MSKIFFLISVTVSSFLFSQQNDEFKKVKDYYGYQREMLSSEFKKKFDNQTDAISKKMVQEEYEEFMTKLDSIQNSALVGALIAVKNREDLSFLDGRELQGVNLSPSTKESVLLEEEPKYPGGSNILRSQIADLFYLDAIKADNKVLKTSVSFIVEKDGSISFVHASGENFTFNRQAEIAVYMLPDKFSPAKMRGENVRYRFKIPLTMNFE